MQIKVRDLRPTTPIATIEIAEGDLHVIAALYRVVGGNPDTGHPRYFFEKLGRSLEALGYGQEINVQGFATIQKGEHYNQFNDRTFDV